MASLHCARSSTSVCFFGGEGLVSTSIVLHNYARWGFIEKVKKPQINWGLAGN